MKYEKLFIVGAVAFFLVLTGILTVSVMGYFRNGDLARVESGIRDVGSGLSDVIERTGGFERAISGFTKLIDGVEAISGHIAESVQQNERGLASFEESIHIVKNVISRIQEEGIVLE
jgi:hypothetical protein